ncbi:MAG: DUF3152 domain-containing protein [Chloroflexi bacterium]|nr:DUF3152 domain-containing protein [Chloroflexota bacterium]
MKVRIFTLGFILGATGMSLVLVFLAATVHGVSAHHPFHEPVIHMTDYHDAVPNVSWGYSFCCTDDPGIQLYSFFEDALGWQALNQYQPTDFYQLSYSAADIAISFVNDGGADNKCGAGASGCVTYDSGTTCVSSCSQDLLHASRINMWVRATYWNGASTNARRDLINHEVGHTLGHAEHYRNAAIYGHIDDTSVYSGVMDNDVGDVNGYPSDREIKAAHWITEQWY